MKVPVNCLTPLQSELVTCSSHLLVICACCSSIAYISQVAHLQTLIFETMFQFFITLGDDLDYLDGVHTVFAEVVEGFEVLDKLSDAICDDEHRPYQDIR